MRRTLCGLLAAWAIMVAGAQAQVPPQVTVTTPMHAVGHSYFEQMGTQWSLRGPGFFARFGGGPTVPPFGRFQPGAGLHGGLGFRGGPWQGNLHFFAGQGSRTSFTTVAPSLTVTQGMPGTMFAGTWSPFVMGVVPVVGRPWPGVPYKSPLQMAIEQLPSRQAASSLPGMGAGAAAALPRGRLRPPPAPVRPPARARRAAPLRHASGKKHKHRGGSQPVGTAWRNDHPGGSLAALRRRAAQQRKADRERAARLFQQAQRYFAQGKLKTAQAFCRQAWPLADVPLRQQIAELLRRIEQLREP